MPGGGYKRRSALRSYNTEMTFGKALPGNISNMAITTKNIILLDLRNNTLTLSALVNMYCSRLKILIHNLWRETKLLYVILITDCIALRNMQATPSRKVTKAERLANKRVMS